MPLTIPPPGTICPALATEPFTFTVYGYPGVGKSPMLSVLPDHFYIDLQMGTRYFACRRVLVTDYVEFTDALTYWRAHPTRFLIIDPLTKLVEWAEEHATNWYRRVPIGHNFTGQTVLELSGKDANTGSPGWLYVRRSFMELLKQAWPGPHQRTIFVGHVRDAMMADASKGERGAKMAAVFDDKDLDLPGKLRHIFLSETDLGAYVYRSATGTLKLTTSAQKNGAFTKCRCPKLLNRTFDFHTPSTLDDWRQIYPESIAELCDTKAVAPVTATAPATPAAPPLPAGPTPAASAKP